MLEFRVVEIAVAHHSLESKPHAAVIRIEPPTPNNETKSYDVPAGLPIPKAGSWIFAVIWSRAFTKELGTSGKKSQRGSCQILSAAWTAGHGLD